MRFLEMLTSSTAIVVRRVRFEQTMSLCRTDALPFGYPRRVVVPSRFERLIPVLSGRRFEPD
jgi:hypothetical protein